ncbi:DUF5689 domain-containing protein [Ulvibacter antarcticus]|uniref:DUF5689 domain-containing protein n=1 Tax=Ulvibacter antarcticus TaxID=442714 RepID=A0A3L9YYP0_9FLAO|nr:DUF5689 domain-containing protein [Ulvibacter antarcticus]RMA65841.1 hypothetical protein BXY75_0254 [Ulvibacter antarcticus]
MKTINIYKFFTLLFAMMVVVSCVQDDEYDLPEQQIVSVDIPSDQLLTMNGVRNLLDSAIDDTGDANALYTFPADVEQYVLGYVISKDIAGNFFEELILQNDPSNPTTGIKVLINANPLSATYEFGRKVFIKVTGLSAGYDSGVLTIGVRDGSELGQIAEANQRDFLLRDDEVAEITPKEITMAEFSDILTNTYIRLNDVQFNRNDVLGPEPKTFAAEPSDEFDGERSLESCATGGSTIFSTSTFADFKGLELPAGRGTLDAILTKNFFGEAFNVVINDPSTINFDQTERCDPNVLTCTTASGGGAVFYSENFEQFNAIEDYEAIGWTNVNITGGNEVWEIGNFSNNNYAQISGFNSGETDIDAWLVTPAINMDQTTGEELSLQIEAAYDNGTILSVLVSTNFTGDVTTAEWSLLDITVPSGPSGGFGGFQDIGPVNISCLDGNINIAFLYEGSDPSATTRYHINNIEVTGN